MPRLFYLDAVPISGTGGRTKWIDVSEFPAIAIGLNIDSAGTLYVEYSPNGPNGEFIGSTLTCTLESAVREPHIYKNLNSFVRFYIVYSGSPTYCHMEVMGHNGAQLTSSLNFPSQQDADAILAKVISEETLIALGLISGYSIVNKFGRNPNIASGSVPEDIWNNSTTYAGFPTGSPEEVKIVLGDAGDVGGIVTFQYLASSTSTAWASASITTTGTTTNTGITAYRVHTAQYLKGTATGFNAGTVTIQHVTTTTNIFIVMPAGTGQSYSAGYTIPTGSTGYIRRFFARVYNNTAGSVEGALWVRQGTTNPRLRRPFTASNTSFFEEYPYGGLTITGPADIQVRVTASSATVTVTAGYDLILAKN